MLRVRRPARIALLVTLFALLPLGSARAARSGSPDPGDPFWLGPYFAGLRLTHSSSTSDASIFSYGDCEFPEGEGGCRVPATVQNASSCERNPLAIDRVPFRVFLLRGGGVAAEYERTAIDITTGSQTVALGANEVELVPAELRDFRRRTEAAPQPLAPPVYPPAALRELKRVTVAKQRFGSISAAAKAIHVPDFEVKVRLEIADLLPPGTLADVPAPRISTAALERLRQLAFRTQYNLPRAARVRGISVAALRKKIAPVRGLTGYCWPLAGS
jgi:hypothetical protein